MAWLVEATVAPGHDGRKHMFDSALDAEPVFGQDRRMERTYVRRRRAVGLLATSLVAVLLTPLAAGAVRHGQGRAAPTPVQQVVVREGDTLWSIAVRVRPAEDPRATVEAIVSSNGVEAGSLVPGQSLAVPLA
jgi:LysM domain